MSESVQTQAELLTAFADGQGTGAITPEDVRNFIVSVGWLAGFNQAAAVYPNGNESTSLAVSLANGSVQSVVMTGASLALTLSNPAIGANTRLLLELYVTNNSSGNGEITWPTNVTWFGSTPGPIQAAASITRFYLVSLDGGATWSVMP